MKWFKILLILLLIPSLSWGATYYMRADGTDADSDCSGSSACCAGSMDVSDHNADNPGLAAGDTVVRCANGGDITARIIPPVTGTSGNPITYTTNGDVVHDGSGAFDSFRGAANIDYITIDGGEIKDGNSHGLDTNSGDNWIVQNVTAHDNTGYGLRASGGSIDVLFVDSVAYNNTVAGIGCSTCTGLIIRRCTSYDNTTVANADGFFIGTATNPTIEYSVAYGNTNGASADGLQIQDSPNATVRYNYIYDNGNSEVLFGGTGTYATVYGNVIKSDTASQDAIHLDLQTGNTVIYNNIIYNGQFDINTIADPQTLTVTNNIFHGNTGVAVNEAVGVDNALITMDYNLIYNTSGTMISWEGNNYTQAQFASYQSTESQDSNSSTSDPKFIAPSNNLFIPKAESPAKGKGTDLGSTYENMLSPNAMWPGSVQLLKQRSNWDIGAYKSLAGPMPTVTPVPFPIPIPLLEP